MFCTVTHTVSEGPAVCLGKFESGRSDKDPHKKWDIISNITLSYFH